MRNTVLLVYVPYIKQVILCVSKIIETAFQPTICTIIHTNSETSSPYMPNIQALQTEVFTFHSPGINRLDPCALPLP
jgi:hypothetical protein